MDEDGEKEDEAGPHAASVAAFEGARHGRILGTPSLRVNLATGAFRPRRRSIGYNPGVPRPLPRTFYARDTVTVARELLGCILARRLADGATLLARIVETEAYVGEEDKACHARAGRTPRTDVLYGPPGVAYVYLTYGMHHLLNAVSEPEGRPAAVLIRAAEPLEGIERMARGRGFGARGRRPGARKRGPAIRGSGARAALDAPVPHNLASGPAKLCQAFALDLRQNRADLRGPDLWIEPGDPFADREIATSPRIGCHTVPAPWDRIPWRFFVAGSPFVTPGGAPRGGGTSRPSGKNSG